MLQKIYAKLPVIVLDALLIPVAWYLAYGFRFNLQVLPQRLLTNDSQLALLIIFILQLVSYYHFKVYRGLWRFSSLGDMSRIVRSVIITTLLALAVFYISGIIANIPRSILPLFALILISCLCGVRLLRRSLWDAQQNNNPVHDIKRVLIIGAGRAGEGLIRDLNRTNTYLPVALIDDSASKIGLEVHGVCVVGNLQALLQQVIKHNIDLIFIAIPSATSAQMRVIVKQCELAGIDFRALPSLNALASGRVQVNALREVNIEDLLGRAQVNLSWDKIAECINNTRVLITGAGGSIGSELCRQILQLNPASILLLDNSEYNLYKIEFELQQNFPHIKIRRALVSVTDKVAIEHVFKEFLPDIVFHAAAYKHVPMLEDQVRVAVVNNVLGTKIVAEASVHTGVKTFLLISTDKAVNPTNVMGTTKRVAEIFCQNLNEQSSTQFITVRFGNVLGSVGSVVPLFKQQLAQGGPLTVTHPDITRYFMTIPEASQLILQAMINGTGGEIFVLDMGEPIKISYLAEQLIRLSGKEHHQDIKIQYTGLRPGEKLFEELFHESENLVKTTHTKLFQAQFRKIDWLELSQIMNLFEKAVTAHQTDELLVLLKNLVPEFCGNLLTADSLHKPLVV